MNWLLFIYLPIALSITWAVKNSYKRWNATEALLVAFVGMVIVANGVIGHFLIQGYEMSNSVVLTQEVLSSLVVPCSYLFFARQVGRSVTSETSLLLLLPISLLLLPNIVIVSNFSNMSMLEDVGYKTFVVVGEDIDCYNISDFIIVLQSVITAARVVPLYKKVRKYGLCMSFDVKKFILWWCSSILFVIFASLNSENGEYNAIIDVVCHIVFMVIVTIAFVMVGRGFDLRPMISEDKERVELDAFVRKSKEMSVRLNVLINEDCVYKINGYNADDAIAALATNRTYFYRMVRAEFGCKFSELLNKRRVEMVKKLLETTDEGMNVIAEECGFGSPSYMIKIFRQLEGVTPKEWRDAKNVN